MTIYQIIIGIIYLIFGVTFLLSPPKAFKLFDVKFVESNNSLNEFKGAYGGVNTIIGIMGLVSIYFTSLINPFLWLILVTNLGYALGRAYAYSNGNRPTIKLLLIWSGEVAIIVSAIVFLILQSN